MRTGEFNAGVLASHPREQKYSDRRMRRALLSHGGGTITWEGQEHLLARCPRSRILPQFPFLKESRTRNLTSRLADGQVQFPGCYRHYMARFKGRARRNCAFSSRFHRALNSHALEQLFLAGRLHGERHRENKTRDSNSISRNSLSINVTNGLTK